MVATMVKNIKLERGSPLQGRIEGLGIVYQVITCTALWDKIGQINSKVAYKGPVFVTVPRYNRLGPYLSLQYHFWAVLSLSVRFDHIKVKVPGKRESALKWTTIIQYEPLLLGITNYGHIWHSISNSDLISASAPEKASYGLWRYLVADNE